MANVALPVPDNEEYIKIRVVGQDQSEVHFRVRMGTVMSKVKDGYAKRTGVDLKALRFLFDGTRVENSDTPRTLGMEDEDTIEVYQEQLGGSN